MHSISTAARSYPRGQPVSCSPGRARKCFLRIWGCKGPPHYLPSPSPAVCIDGMLSRGRAGLCSSRARPPRRASASAGTPAPRAQQGTGSVYVASTPLQGWEALEPALGTLLPSSLAMHTVCVLQTHGDGVCRAYDFLPRDPEAPETAARLLTGRGVPGAGGPGALPLAQTGARSVWGITQTWPVPGAGRQHLWLHSSHRLAALVPAAAVQVLRGHATCRARRACAVSWWGTRAWPTRTRQPPPSSSAGAARSCAWLAAIAARTRPPWCACC